MAKGYPSKTRARKAFRRGVLAGNRHRPRESYRSMGITNPRLVALFLRGWELGRQTPLKPVPMPDSVIEGLVNAEKYVRPGERAVTLGELKRRVEDRRGWRGKRPGHRRGGW